MIVVFNFLLNVYVVEILDLVLSMVVKFDEWWVGGNVGCFDGVLLGIKDLYCIKGVCIMVCFGIFGEFILIYESMVM